MNLNQFKENANKYGEYNVFHYTSFTNAQCILKDQLIRGAPARYTSFGCGVFMTTLLPDESDSKITLNNYNKALNRVDKVECAFAFQKSQLKCTKIENCGRDVWRNNSDIDLTMVDYILVLRKNV